MHRVTRPELKRHDERNRLEPRRLPPSPGGGPRPREAETILGHQPGPQRNGLTKEAPVAGLRPRQTRRPVTSVERRMAVRVTSLVALTVLWSLAGHTQPVAEVTFHHVHMNVVDPQQSIAFYTDAFEQTQRTVVAGWDALRSEDSYILFSRVTSPRSAEWDTPIWHFGWNSPDVVATHERLVSRGVSFFRVPPPSGHMIAPDGNDVEITPGGGSGPGPTAFNHVHLMSDAPLCAANWYVAMLGLRREADAEAPDDCDVPFAERRDPANQIHQPNTRLYAGDILIFIYPNQRLVALSQRPVEDRGVLVSSRGRVLDHIAFAVRDVSAVVARMRRAGVTILEDVHDFGNSTLRAAMVEGPDAIAVELVERSPTPVEP